MNISVTNFCLFFLSWLLTVGTWHGHALQCYTLAKYWSGTSGFGNDLPAFRTCVSDELFCFTMRCDRDDGLQIWKGCSVTNRGPADQMTAQQRREMTEHMCRMDNAGPGCRAMRRASECRYTFCRADLCNGDNKLATEVVVPVGDSHNPLGRHSDSHNFLDENGDSHNSHETKYNPGNIRDSNKYPDYDDSQNHYLGLSAASRLCSAVPITVLAMIPPLLSLLMVV